MPIWLLLPAFGLALMGLETLLIITYLHFTTPKENRS